MYHIHTLKVRQAKGILPSIIGLIGAPKPYPLLLRTRFGIHTFGVRFPIDVLILDKQSRVVRMKKSLLPQRFFFWPPTWSIVLELPVNTIDQNHIQPGDHIHFVTD